MRYESMKIDPNSMSLAGIADESMNDNSAAREDFVNSLKASTPISFLQQRPPLENLYQLR